MAHDNASLPVLLLHQRDADFGTEIDRIQEFNKLRLTFLLLLIVSFFSLLKNSFIICRTFQTLPSIL